MTQENFDHETPLDRSQDLSVDEIAARLNVNRRTIYRIVEREGWQKNESLRGRVSYTVPLAFIDRYVAESQKDRRTTSDTSQDGNPSDQGLSLSANDNLLNLIVGDRDRRIEKLEQVIDDQQRVIDELRQSLQMSQLELAAFKTECKGKDELVKAKDDIIQAKDQAINAANAAVMLMEQQKQTLDVQTPKQIETALKKPWWRLGF